MGYIEQKTMQYVVLAKENDELIMSESYDTLDKAHKAFDEAIEEVKDDYRFDLGADVRVEIRDLLGHDKLIRYWASDESFPTFAVTMKRPLLIRAENEQEAKEKAWLDFKQNYSGDPDLIDIEVEVDDYA